MAAPIPSKRLPKTTPAPDADKSPADLIDARIRQLNDWRGVMLARGCGWRSAVCAH